MGKTQEIQSGLEQAKKTIGPHAKRGRKKSMHAIKKRVRGR